MGLPIIKHPTFELTIPSSKQQFKFRPFLVKEEKILLLAQSGKDVNDMIKSIKQIITNCLLEGDLNVDSLPSFDIEYIFLKLRINSVSPEVELVFPEPGTDKEQKVKVDLNEVEVHFNKDHTNKIDVGNGIMMVLKYPTYADIGSVDLEQDVGRGTLNMVQLCTDSILSGENYEQVDKFKDYSDDEVQEFLESLTTSGFLKLQTFFETMPKLEHTIEYESSDGKKQTHTFSGISDFFSYA
jgi:hypothetical protein